MRIRIGSRTRARISLPAALPPARSAAAAQPVDGLAVSIDNKYQHKFQWNINEEGCLRSRICRPDRTCRRKRFSTESRMSMRSSSCRTGPPFSMSIAISCTRRPARKRSRACAPQVSRPGAADPIWRCPITASPRRRNRPRKQTRSGGCRSTPCPRIAARSRRLPTASVRPAPPATPSNTPARRYAACPWRHA